MLRIHSEIPYFVEYRLVAVGKGVNDNPTTIVSLDSMPNATLGPPVGCEAVSNRPLPHLWCGGALSQLGGPQIYRRDIAPRLER